MSGGGVKQRATVLSPHDFMILDHWGRQLYDAFAARPYLVGSVARADQGFRDVDVRVLLPEDAGWLIEFPDMEGAIQSLRLRTINMAVTLWGRRVTGLPIDFQFQPESEWRSYDDERRAALGISLKVTAQEAWDRREVIESARAEPEESVRASDEKRTAINVVEGTDGFRCEECKAPWAPVLGRPGQCGICGNRTAEPS